MIIGKRNISNQQVIDAVVAKVDALPNLTAQQRNVVREIAIAAALKNGLAPGTEPNYEGIAHLVRSNASHVNNKERPYPTNNTDKCFGAKQ